MKIYSFTFIIY